MIAYYESIFKVTIDTIKDDMRFEINKCSLYTCSILFAFFLLECFIGYIFKFVELY